MSQIIRLAEIFHQNDYDATDDYAIAVVADALVIPVTHAYVAKTTGGDAEALTLANGKPGQILVINLAVDGNGDGTLTPATATGWATIVFADAFDQAVLYYVDDYAGWRIWSLTGTGGPPAHT
jgi:hypothetical protein